MVEPQSVGPAVNETIKSNPSGTPLARSGTGVVLFILPWSPDYVGGVNDVVLNLTRWIAAHSPCRPKLLVNDYRQQRIEQGETQTLGLVDWFYVPAPASSNANLRGLLSFMFRLPACLFRLVRYLRRERVCAINFHYPSLALFPLIMARRLVSPSIPVVASFHGTDVQQVAQAGSFQQWLWRWVLNRCEGVVVCSKALRCELNRALPTAGFAVTVIHNGIDSESCRRSAESATLPDTLRGRRYVACVAKFERRKGHDVLIGCFREMVDIYPDLYLVLVGGSGPEFDEINALADAQPIAGRILLYRDLSHDQTLKVIAGAELLVLPSRYEPFGIVLLESACLDTPVVASSVDGIPEIVEAGVTGTLVPPDDREALKCAICTLLDDHALAETYRRNFRKTVEQQFSFDRTAKSYADILAIDEADRD